MERICVFLLLLLSQTSAGQREPDIIDMEQESGPDNSKVTITDLLAELKELRDMVIAQKTELSNSKSRIEKLEEEKSVLDARVSASESEAAELKTQITELISRLTTNDNKDTVLDARVNASESEVEELKKQITESPKVAFSIGLTDALQIGPFSTDITLKFSKVLTNFGQAYNTRTGVFTAPIRGVYYFRFTAFGLSNRGLGVSLYHNDKRVLWNSDHDEISYVTFSNAVILELEKGDAVYLVLPRSYVIYDDAFDRTFFSGFLIFPL